MTPSTALGRNARLRWTVLLIAVVGALGTAACGSESGPGKTPGNPENAEQRQAYRACMAQNGVQMPEPSGGQRQKIDAEHPPAGVDPAAWDRARQACASLAPPRQKNG